MCLLRVAYFETVVLAEGSLNDEGGLVLAEIANLDTIFIVCFSKNFRRPSEEL